MVTACGFRQVSFDAIVKIGLLVVAKQESLHKYRLVSWQRGTIQPFRSWLLSHQASAIIGRADCLCSIPSCISRSAGQCWKHSSGHPNVQPEYFPNYPHFYCYPDSTTAVLVTGNRVWRYINHIFEDVKPYAGLITMYKWVCLVGCCSPLTSMDYWIVNSIRKPGVLQTAALCSKGEDHHWSSIHFFSKWICIFLVWQDPVGYHKVCV
jgi:hypothetical protein